jgi:hypothetical protein
MPRGAEVSPPCSPLSPLLTGSRGPRRGGGHVLWQSGVLCTLRATARHRDSVGRQRLNCLAGSSAAESLRIHRGEMEIETLQPSHEYKSPRPPGAALNATALFRPYAEAGIRPSASDAVAVPPSSPTSSLLPPPLRARPAYLAQPTDTCLLCTEHTYFITSARNLYVPRHPRHPRHPRRSTVVTVASSR